MLYDGWFLFSPNLTARPTSTHTGQSLAPGAPLLRSFLQEQTNPYLCWGGYPKAQQFEKAAASAKEGGQLHLEQSRVQRILCSCSLVSQIEPPFHSISPVHLLLCVGAVHIVFEDLPRSTAAPAGSAINTSFQDHPPISSEVWVPRAVY